MDGVTGRDGVVTVRKFRRAACFQNHPGHLQLTPSSPTYRTPGPPGYVCAIFSLCFCFVWFFYRVICWRTGCSPPMAAPTRSAVLSLSPAVSSSLPISRICCSRSMAIMFCSSA